MLLLVALTLAFCSQVSLAQVQSDVDRRPEAASQCSQSLERAEFKFRNGHGGEAAKSFENDLRTIMRVCPAEDIDPKYRSQLDIVMGENAECSFMIAKYYFDEFLKNGHSLKGAQSRFKNIETEYPDFSKLDEALFLLGETYRFESDYEHAENTFNKLIDKFPASNFAYKGQVALQEIRYLKSTSVKPEDLP